MRTEWFIGLAGLVLLVLGAVAVIEIRDSDDPTATPSPSPTNVSPTTPSTPSPEPEPSDTPSATPSASPTPTEEPSESESPTDSPTPEPTSTSSNGGDDGAAISRVSVSFDGADSRFGAAGADNRVADFKKSCPLVPDDDEVFTQCRPGYSYSQDRWWAVTEAASGQNHVATLWQHNGQGAWDRVSMTGAYSSSMTLGGPTWPNHDDVMTLDFGTEVEVLSYETSAGPLVTGVIPLSSVTSFEVIAQRVFVWTSGANRSTTVLKLKPAGGLEGKRANLTSASDRSPEEVALTAYRAWVDNDRAAAAPWVNDEVDEALFDESPNTGGDLFELSGTSCPLEDGAFVCTFTFGFGSMTWEVRPVEGVLRVVAIDSMS